MEIITVRPATGRFAPNNDELKYLGTNDFKLAHIKIE